jgi:superfamily I DNA/RNA helicase
MNRTEQQQAAIDAVVAAAASQPPTNFCLRARAGSGKSSTALDMIDAYVAAYPDRRVTLCCFGKTEADKNGEKLKKRGHVNWKTVKSSTIHSMGNSLVQYVFKKPKVEEHKVRNLIRNNNDPVYEEFHSSINDLVHYAKIEGFGFFNDRQIGDTHAWYQIADTYDINGFDDTTQLDDVITAAKHIYKQSLNQTDVVDFDDMILFPLVKNLRVKFQVDLLIIDEAQDTGRARQALTRKFVRPSGITVVIGDDQQAIFAFAGAQHDALDQLIDQLDATILPLTTCFRCPKSVIALAQKIVPDIEAFDGAEEGNVLHQDQLPPAADMLPTDAILCRNTAPLIEIAYSLLRQGVACKVEGREIGGEMLRVVNRWKNITTIAAWLDKLDDYRKRETQKAQAKGSDAKVQSINDRCDTLQHLANACLDRRQTSLDDLRKSIENMFGDDVKAKGLLTLCTYHRAKGREWPRVFLHQHAARCPSPWAKRPEQQEQERHLAYVAITRAQHTLAFVQ